MTANLPSDSRVEPIDGIHQPVAQNLLVAGGGPETGGADSLHDVLDQLNGGFNQLLSILGRKLLFQ